MRSAVIAGVGGALLGHILWLLGMSLATGSSSVSTAVLVVSAALLILAGLLIYHGLQGYHREQRTKAVLLGGFARAPGI